MKKENILIVLLGLATVVVLSLELFVSGQGTTKTETALFSVLQFVFSLGFAWLLSRVSSKTEFEEQQKKFATAAFRRIKEIEFQVNHLITRLTEAVSKEGVVCEHELDVAKTLAISINETTQSSKLDWADVIGDQIEAIDKIENIQRISIAEREISPNSESDISIEDKIEELKKSLSNELKLMVDEKEKPSTQSILEREFKANGSLRLEGFLELDWPGIRNPNELQLDEELSIKLSDQGERIATLAAFDANGTYVGSFLNKYTNSYSDFTRAVCRVIGSSEFKGVITRIRKGPNESNRIYFSVKAPSAENA